MSAMKVEPWQPFYTDTILSTLIELLGPEKNAQYTHILVRVLSGRTSDAASLSALGCILNGSSKAILLHNEVAAMTHDSMHTNNLPELFVHPSALDSSCGSDDSMGQELLDLVDHFAGTERARPMSAEVGRRQVMRYLEAVAWVSTKADHVVEDLAKEMAAMGF